MGGDERFGGPHGLSVIAGGRPYVRVSGTTIRRVLIFSGPSRRPFRAEAEDGGLLLTGYLSPAPDGLRVFPGRTLSLGGLLWPGAFTPLRLIPDPVWGFRVAPVGPLPGALGVPSARLRTRVACGDVALEPSPLFHLAAQAAPYGEPTRLRAGATLPIFARPGGRTLATLRPSKKSGVLLWVQPGVGGWAPVRWDLSAGEIRGWVEERKLREAEVKKLPDGDGLGGLFLGVGGRGGRGFFLGLQSLQCDNQIPVTLMMPPDPGTVDRQPRRVVVGRFLRRAHIPLAGWRAGDLEIPRWWLPPELRIEPGARLLITREHLSRCVRVPHQHTWDAHP